MHSPQRTITIGSHGENDSVIANVFDGQSFAAYSYVRNNPLAFVDPSGFAGEGVVHQPGFPDVPLANDVVTPSLSFLIGQDVRAQLAHPIEPTGTRAPTNDTSTMGGDDDVVVLPIIETDHPGGPGTDDPFGVYPTDIELAHDRPTTFEQLVAGDPAGGRRTFIIQDDPGIGRDIRIAFGADRQTIMLRPHIGGSGIDDRDAAKDRLIGEGVLAAATILTPGPLDDIAVAGLRGGARLLRGGLQAVRDGKAGEAAVRAAVDIGPKKGFLINGRWRIPDGIKDGVLSEVKNVDKLSYTRQLRDYAAHARQENLTFHLYVKRGTKVSAKLKEAIDNGTIIRRFIP